VSRWTPCRRRDFIRRLRELGFDGPYLVLAISSWSMGSNVWQSLPMLNTPCLNSEC